MFVCAYIKKIIFLFFILPALKFNQKYRFLTNIFSTPYINQESVLFLTAIINENESYDKDQIKNTHKNKN